MMTLFFTLFFFGIWIPDQCPERTLPVLFDRIADRDLQRLQKWWNFGNSMEQLRSTTSYDVVRRSDTESIGINPPMAQVGGVAHLFAGFQRHLAIVSTFWCEVHQNPVVLSAGHDSWHPLAMEHRNHALWVKTPKSGDVSDILRF